jgi:hypothetical protein
MPPAHAPVNVGEGGNQAPVVANSSCIAATVSPASTVIRSLDRSTTRVIFDVAMSSSPIGVAPPVNDDWAPIGRTAGADLSASAMSLMLRGKTTPDAWPPG